MVTLRISTMGGESKGGSKEKTSSDPPLSGPYLSTTTNVISDRAKTNDLSRYHDSLAIESHGYHRINMTCVGIRCSGALKKEIEECFVMHLRFTLLGLPESWGRLPLSARCWEGHVHKKGRKRSRLIEIPFSPTTPQTWSLFFLTAYFYLVSNSILSFPSGTGLRTSTMLFLHALLFFLFSTLAISVPVGSKAGPSRKGIAIDTLNAVTSGRIPPLGLPLAAHGFWTPLSGHNVSGTLTSQPDLSYIIHLTVRKFSGPA